MPGSSFERMWADLAPVGRHPGSGGCRRYAWTRTDGTLREWFRGEAEERGLDVVPDRAGNLWAWTADPDAVGPGLVVGDPDRARSLTADDGTTMAEAMTAAGFDPRGLGRDDETLLRVGTFLELHVEQGRALAEHDGGAPVGVAAAIWPHGRWRLDLRGRADHAGTTRLADRDDPMIALAAAIQQARRAAGRHGALATVSMLRVLPNGVNAIPSEVAAWLDARGPVEDDVRAVVAEVGDAAGSAPVEESWTPSTDFAPALRDRLAAVLAYGDSEPAPVLPTGAGHDAGILSAAGIPTAMLFVRNPTGVSHSPAEHAEPADCLAGVAALTLAIEALA